MHFLKGDYHYTTILWALCSSLSEIYDIGTVALLKIKFYPPQRPLRDAFLVQNTILSLQKAPAGRFSGSKYNFILPKGPCGTLFRLKIQFYPPKRHVRDAFPIQNAVLSAQKPPAGRFSGSKSRFWKMRWQSFADLINSKVSTHLCNLLNWSDRQKATKAFSKTRFTTQIKKKKNIMISKISKRQFRFMLSYVKQCAY